MAIEDKWVLSRLNSLVYNTSEQYENFEFHLAARGIMDFIVEDLSRTYIKLVRGRDDAGVNATFTQVFDALLKIMAPITPFVADYIYNDLFSKSFGLAIQT